MSEKKNKERKRWIVETHLGDEPTWATSARKAINNIRFRLLGAVDNAITKYWVAREA